MLEASYKVSGSITAIFLTFQYQWRSFIPHKTLNHVIYKNKMNYDK